MMHGTYNIKFLWTSLTWTMSGNIPSIGSRILFSSWTRCTPSAIFVHGWLHKTLSKCATSTARKDTRRYVILLWKPNVNTVTVIRCGLYNSQACLAPEVLHSFVFVNELLKDNNNSLFFFLQRRKPNSSTKRLHLSCIVRIWIIESNLNKKWK